MSNPPKPVPQRQDPAAARVIRAFRIHPRTAKAIRDQAELGGWSQGQVIDRAMGAYDPPANGVES